jgi:hypothetical protein
VSVRALAAIIICRLCTSTDRLILQLMPLVVWAGMLVADSATATAYLAPVLGRSVAENTIAVATQMSTTTLSVRSQYLHWQIPWMDPGVHSQYSTPLPKVAP